MRCSKNKIYRKSHTRKSYRKKNGSMVKKTRVSSSCVRRSKSRSRKNYRFMTSLASSYAKRKAIGMSSSIKSKVIKNASKLSNKAKVMAKTQAKELTNKL